MLFSLSSPNFMMNLFKFELKNFVLIMSKRTYKFIWCLNSLVLTPLSHRATSIHKPYSAYACMHESSLIH